MRLRGAVLQLFPLRRPVLLGQRPHPVRLGFAVRSFCHNSFGWPRALAINPVRGRNPLQLHAGLVDADSLAGVRQHVEAVAVAAVHGVVDGIHAIERGRNTGHAHLVAKLKRPTPGLEQIARQRQPARVAAVAPRNARIVGREEGPAIGLARHGPVGGGRYGIYRAVSVGLTRSDGTGRRSAEQ